tara:strand:- start:9541 stop:10449 length:909 start_codon:yes stop_codon:yes gene_type:complete
VKVFINRKPVSGPWGGGNKTVSALASALEPHASVVFDLDHSDIDVIFCFDPRPCPQGVWYQHFLDYREKHGCKIIQRVGDVGTHGKPDLFSLVSQSTNLSDFIIFPSEWARNEINYRKDNYKVISNAPLDRFYLNRDKRDVPAQKLNIVTHHWSTNTMKGFDIYEKLGEYCINRDDIRFTYIGRYPSSAKTAGINLIDPKDIDFLSKEIPMHDIYLTASKLEAGANHVLEALAAGLPVIYREGGGSIDEYCKDYGERYSDFNSLVSAIEKVSSTYPDYKGRALNFSLTIEETIKKYLDIILL